MPHSENSEDFDFDDNDNTEIIAAATQVEASQCCGFEPSQRPTKRRRISKRPRQLDGASSDTAEWSETDEEAHSPAELALAPPRQQQTQVEANEERELETVPEDYFPEELGLDDRSAKTSKYKIHIPKEGGYYEDQIVTQTQHGLDRSPSQFRGAVWKRPERAPLAPQSLNAATRNGKTHVGGGDGAVGPRTKQTTLHGMYGTHAPRNGFPTNDSFHGDAELAARLQAEEDVLASQSRQSKKPIIPPEGPTQNDFDQELADLPSDAFSSSSPEKSARKDVIFISSQVTIPQQPARSLRGPQQGLKQMTIFGQPATQDLSATQAAKKKHAWPLASREEPPTHHKLDDKAMETFVYPTNLGTVRAYQNNIVKRCLFHNTLVALPTGLGKTFIAATVMLNYFRWTKNAQMIFMAPTKPLIAQQMEACYKIAGIPRDDTVLMTGETAPGLRTEEWLERRVFFMTPQTVINDLKTGICDPKRVVLIVVDEAHKAKGGYAYTEVNKFLRRFNTSFRVLALTATPGKDVETVQAVIDNLDISRVEIRTEESLDIRPYTFEKQTDIELFDFSEEQDQIMELFGKALQPVVDKLRSQNAYWSRDPLKLHVYILMQERRKWAASEAGQKAPQSVKWMVNSIFTVLTSLAHSIPLLKFHGIYPFYHKALDFQKGIESGESKGKYAKQIAESEHFIKMMGLIRGWTSNVDFIGHPKLEYLREIVLNHFLNTGEGMQGPDVPPSATRVMIFSSFRDSTEEIVRVLKRHEPMIRPHVFVGQSASKNSEGMDQKKQNAVIQDFKKGKYNTLVATSIGEEGLDIGDVDLIVNYDQSASPIRMLQRVGRTGRKRSGRVVLLLMREKEETDYQKSLDGHISVQKIITEGEVFSYRHEQSARILPKSVTPVEDRRVIDIPPENTQPIELNERNRKARGKAKAKRPPKKFHMPDGVRTGFTKASRLDSDDEGEEQPKRKSKPPARKKSPAEFKRPSAQLEPEPVQVPFLESVLLDSAQQSELESRYARIADGEGDLVIRPPDLTRYTNVLRHLGPSKYVSRGKISNVVSRTLRAIHDIDGERIEKMRVILNVGHLKDAGPAKARLIRTTNGILEDEDEDELPPARSRTPKPKAADGVRSRTDQVQRTTPEKAKGKARLHKSETTSAAPTKKARGRPKKMANVRRVPSYGSAADEGDESSPEPTPANMRLGTQGIDLGSRDTSGEDNDEEPDSELEDFIVGSDLPVEMASSPQRLPDDTQAPERQRERAKGLTNGVARRSKVLEDIASESNRSDHSIDLSDLIDSDSSVVEEVTAPAVPAAKKRRIINDSDSDE